MTTRPDGNPIIEFHIPPTILNGRVRSVEDLPCMRHVEDPCSKGHFTLGRIILNQFALPQYR